MFQKPISIGDVFPPAARKRGPSAGLADPAWYALETPPQGEGRAADWLQAWGVEAWHPTETAWRTVRGRNRRTIAFERPVVPRFIFARFTGWPQWDILFWSRRITGFIGVAGLPRRITDAEMSGMAKVPDRIAEAKAKEAEARIVRTGDMATILDGAMAGWQVQVRAISGEMARFVVPILGERETEISLCRLVKAHPVDRRP